MIMCAPWVQRPAWSVYPLQPESHSLNPVQRPPQRDEKIKRTDIFLPRFGEEVVANDSLYVADIVRVERYAQWNRAIKHRFLLLEITQAGKSSTWLRIDRRSKGLLALLLGFGSTLANDRVSWACLSVFRLLTQF